MSDKRMGRMTSVKTDKYIDDEDLKPNHPVDPDTGLPYQAFAIVKDVNDPNSWFLPHHTKLINRSIKGKIGYEHTVNWNLVDRAVQLLSLKGIDGERVRCVEEGYIISAARHLASHYQKADKPLPDALAVLV